MADSINFGHINSDVRNRIKRYILLKLGAPIIKVELDDANIDEAISIAFENFFQWSTGTEKLTVLNCVPGVSRYNLAQVLGTQDFLFVRDVVYNRFTGTGTVGDFIGNFLGGGLYPEWGFGFISTYGSNMTDYYIQTMYNEMFIRTIGAEGTWSIVGQDLILSPVPQGAERCGIIWTAPPTDDTVKRLEWVREWALAESMEMLGNIRGKWPGGVPGPRGGNYQLDGDYMRKTAAEMKKDLLARRDEYIEPIGFIVG